jgi:hypothetical protein
VSTKFHHPRVFFMEAPTGFEPVYTVLQTVA